MSPFKGLILVITVLLCSAPQTKAQMSAHFINVGQAESILLELKTAAILIDAGGEVTGDNRDRDHLIDYLNKFFQRRTDLKDAEGRGVLYSVIVSHPHIDHTRHLMGVMNGFKVKNLVGGGGTTGSGLPQFNQARRFARDNNIIYNRILDSRIGENGYTTALMRALSDPSGVDIRFLSGYRTSCEDENNESVILRVKYGEATFLFTGDAESEDDDCDPQISLLLDWYTGTLLDVDVYKVGHHGSRNGTTRAYMLAMSPEISVISAGHHSTRSPGVFHGFHFGHPRESIVALLEELTSGTRPAKDAFTMDAVQTVREPRQIEKAVYCTCWDGDVVISTDQDGTQFQVQTSQ
jgi:competence protein ComEC